ncbi:uncharacterized protein CMU_020190 [Cryptosporidium muris RN66]|uniref:Uncharacterized protein n=1 Tax=Cryptosporidium muris (strain RN66) TaxID=441375 RepID=B6AJD8_CRYMR|nr:uncharacterized protein CMU_020190 [Cryptosporidium muris RN66]EEA08276.1 hypothetical protein, conserved [Cryptosporidium muris RN66]|eukprot:XP_002142625.1 hypothetical protein [Cryptosporidium muris RN66]
MTDVEVYRETLGIIKEYIFNKYGPKEDSVIDSIIKSKGIPPLPQCKLSNTKNKKKTKVNTPKDRKTTKVNRTNTNLIPVNEYQETEKNQSPNKEIDRNYLFHRNNKYPFNNSMYNPKTKRKYSKNNKIDNINYIEENTARANGFINNISDEDKSSQVRSILRMAASIEELNMAIQLAYSVGLNYEAGLGERKLKKLLEE